MKVNNQEEATYYDTEIDLKKVIKSLFKRKLFIAGLTSFVTLLSILYVLNLSSTYSSTASFRSTIENSVISLNRLEFVDETKRSLLKKFMNNLTSLDLKIEVFFNDSDYLEVLNDDNYFNLDNSQKRAAALSFVNSIEVFSPFDSMGPVERRNKNDDLIENSYIVSMSGANANNISRYLDKLLASADRKTISDIVKLSKYKTDLRLEEISEEIKNKLLISELNRLVKIKLIETNMDQKIREINNKIKNERFKADKNRLRQITVLLDSAKLSKSAGFIKNNFVLEDDSNRNTENVNLIFRDVLPEWVLYGEKVILKRIDLLESRTNNDPFIGDLIELQAELALTKENEELETLKSNIGLGGSENFKSIKILEAEKNRLENSSLKIINSISSMQVFKPAQSSIYNLNKIRTVLIAFFVSLIISIFLALFMIALKWDEEESS